MEIQLFLQKDKIPTTFAEICKSEDNLSECIINSYNTLGAVYYHDSNLINGAEDNSYRYAGSNPNNYVCFESSVDNCKTDNLYRIIGVIDNKIKIIKDTSIGNYAWDTNTSNTWSTSSINTYLNGEYLTSLGNLTDKILTTTWKVGGNISEKIKDVIPKVVYQNEIVNPTPTNSTDNMTTYDAKIGLMYVSDYGYAASPSAWLTSVYNYSDNNISGTPIRKEIWLYKSSEWTISRNAEYSRGAFFINTAGRVNIDNVTVTRGIRPVFNIDTTTKYISGIGTASSPFILS